MTDHNRYDEMVGPYLLGALADDERERFDAHLATCHECRDEVADLRLAVDAIPAGIPQFEAPPELRERIMSIVHREAELLAAAGPDADRVAAAPEPRPSRLSKWLSGWSLAGPLAGLATAAALAIVVFGSGDELRTVEAAQAPKGAAVRMHIDEEHSTLVAENLPRPPRGRVYQVWLKAPGRPPEATRALFSPGETGTVSVDVPGSMEGIEAVLVTDEPIGGSDAPTTEPVIAVTPS